MIGDRKGGNRNKTQYSIHKVYASLYTVIKPSNTEEKMLACRMLDESVVYYPVKKSKPKKKKQIYTALVSAL